MQPQYNQHCTTRTAAISQFWHLLQNQIGLLQPKSVIGALRHYNHLLTAFSWPHWKDWIEAGHDAAIGAAIPMC